jgi:hypothetical protein
MNRTSLVLCLWAHALLPALLGARGQELGFSIGHGKAEGPTVLVLATHGTRDDADFEALRQARGWQLEAGRLLCAAPIAPQLRLSRHPESEGIVGIGMGATPRSFLYPNVWPRRATDLAELLREFTPDWVLVLSEDFDFHGQIVEAQGATVAASSKDARAAGMASSLCKELNSGIEEDWRRWQPVNLPSAPGEERKTHAAHVLRITSSAKNPRKLQRLALRTRQQRLAICHVLKQLGMLTSGSSPDHLTPTSKTACFRLAIFDGPGAISSSGHGPGWIRNSLLSSSRIDIELVSPEGIAAGVLEGFDSVLFGGGSSRQQGESLGEKGRRAVRRFVQRGGGYVGICAGAFLAMSDRESSLRFFEIDPSGTSGSGVLDLELTDAAQRHTGMSGRHPCKFSGGPHIPLNRLRGDYEVWAWFGRDLERAGKESVPLARTPAVIAAQSGKGRVVAFSPHPERWPGPRDFLRAALRWSAGRPVAVQR